MSEAHVERELSPSARLNYGPVSSLQLQLVFKIIWAQRFLITPGHGVAAYYYLEVYVQLYFLPTTYWCQLHSSKFSNRYLPYNV
jgi:hypothetical protein